LATPPTWKLPLSLNTNSLFCNEIKCHFALKNQRIFLQHFYKTSVYISRKTGSHGVRFLHVSC